MTSVEASKILGCTRHGIIMAIRRGRLKASQRPTKTGNIEKGRWEINPKDLKVYREQTPLYKEITPQPPHECPVCKNMFIPRRQTIWAARKKGQRCYCSRECRLIGWSRWHPPPARRRSDDPNNNYLSSLEQRFDRAMPKEVQYTGDFSLWLTFGNGKQKNPDFVIDGQQKAIELYGNYWHKNDDPVELVAEYERIGWECLVIWESEFYEAKTETLERVSKFIGRGSWQMTFL